MTAVLRSELLKVRTTRSFWWTLVTGFALVALFALVILADGSGSESDVRDVLTTPGIVGLLMIILGVVGAGGEYRHGTITSSLLTVPDRLRFLVAKAFAFLLSGAFAALVASALALVIAIVWLNGDGTSISDLGIDGGEAAGIVIGNLAYAAIGAAFGVAIGALARNQIAAIVGVLLLLLFVDPLLATQFEAYGTYSLTGLGDGLDGLSGSSGDYEPLSRGAAAAVFFAYSAVLIGICAVVDGRRDVSS